MDEDSYIPKYGNLREPRTTGDIYWHHESGCLPEGYRQYPLPTGEFHGQCKREGLQRSASNSLQKPASTTVDIRRTGGIYRTRPRAGPGRAGAAAGDEPLRDQAA